MDVPADENDGCMDAWMRACGAGFRVWRVSGWEERENVPCPWVRDA